MSKHYFRQSDPQTEQQKHMTDSRKIIVAQYVSNFLAPALVLPLAVIFVALYHMNNLVFALFYASMTLLIPGLGPFIYILFNSLLGNNPSKGEKVTFFGRILFFITMFGNLFIHGPKRTDRLMPFLSSLVFIIITLLLLQITSGPKNLETLLIIGIVSGIIMTVTALWWNICVHTSLLTVAATMLTALYGVHMVVVFLLVILAGWSRVVLQRHTKTQAVAGSVLSILITILILVLRGT